jgi:hypothetical protein
MPSTPPQLQTLHPRSLSLISTSTLPMPSSNLTTASCPVCFLRSYTLPR